MGGNAQPSGLRPAPTGAALAGILRSTMRHRDSEASHRLGISDPAVLPPHPASSHRTGLQFPFRDSIELHPQLEGSSPTPAEQCPGRCRRCEPADTAASVASIGCNRCSEARDPQWLWLTQQLPAAGARSCACASCWKGRAPAENTTGAATGFSLIETRPGFFCCNVAE